MLYNINPKLKFKVLKKKWKARVGQIELNWITLTTPVFMPVWTKAAIKAILPEFFINSKFWLGIETPINLILANTFHLYLRPGDIFIKEVWWLHKFENRDKLILTDSGWFQVFSLWLARNVRFTLLDKVSNRVKMNIQMSGWKKENLIKLTEEGVWFKSPIDGSKHFFYPEKVVDIQANLGSDIMMVLDVCSPVYNISKDEVAYQMQLTHKWAKRAFDYFLPKYNEIRWVLFPIVQWGIYKDLRQQSVEYLSQFAIDWIAIWGLSVWETKEQMYKILQFLSDKLPEDKPRYLRVFEHQKM